MHAFTVENWAREAAKECWLGESGIIASGASRAGANRKRKLSDQIDRFWLALSCVLSVSGQLACQVCLRFVLVFWPHTRWLDRVRDLR